MKLENVPLAERIRREVEVARVRADLMAGRPAVNCAADNLARLSGGTARPDHSASNKRRAD